MSLDLCLSCEPSNLYFFLKTHLQPIGLVLNGGSTNFHVLFLMRASYSFHMDSFHSSWEVDSSKQVGPRLVDNSTHNHMKHPCYLDHLGLNYLHYLHIVLRKFWSLSFRPYQDEHFQVFLWAILVDVSKMDQVSQVIEMVLSSHQSSIFQSSRSHHPTEIQVLMKWQELIHEGKMVLHKEILDIDPI